MPSAKEHKEFARNLAKALGLDAKKAEVGATMADLDIHAPLVHRSTLHNPIIPISLLRFDKSLALGYASHLILDDLPISSRLFQFLLEVNDGIEQKRKRR